MTPPAAAAGYNQVFLDDFPGSSLDTVNNWTVSNGSGSDSGIGTFQSSVGTVANSLLTLTVTGSPNYFQWHMLSKRRWLYGYFEVRYQLPVETLDGPWCAPLWLWNSDDAGTPATKYQEIDVVEPHAPAGSGQQFSNVIYQINSKLQSPSSYGSNPWDGQFHVAGLLWTVGNITFYLDGAQVYTLANPFVAIPNRPMNLACDAKVGGFGGTPDAGLVFPLVTNIDYIAVYQPQRAPMSVWN